MSFDIENLSALLGSELKRAIKRMKASRRDLKRSIAALRAERARRKRRRKERL